MTIPPKKVINSDPGTADIVGGNDWDDLADFLNDVDKTGPVKINTDMRFRSGKKKLMNPANTFGYVETASAILADRVVTEPLLTTGDTRVYQAFPQTLTNKTIDVVSNTIATRQHTILMIKSGSTYYAIKYDGTIISQSTTAQTVIQAAINNKGQLYFADTKNDGSGTNTDWQLSGAFTGFTLPRSVRIIGESIDVYIGVPQGFSGIMWKVGGAGNDPGETVSFKNIAFYEQGTPQRLWTAVKMEIQNGGSGFAQKYENIEVYDANIGIELETTGTGWITNALFKDMVFFGTKTGILFDEQGDQISECLFENIAFEANFDATRQAFKNISGTNHIFLCCRSWDNPAGGIEANILSSSSGTTIIGGRMTGGGGHFIDQGNKTLILDSGNIVTSRLLTTPDLCKMGAWNGNATTIGDGMLNGRLSQIAVGTGSDSANYTSSGGGRTFDTGAITGGISGLRLNSQSLSRQLNCYFKAAPAVDSTSDIRVFCGFTDQAAAPVASSDPLSARSGVALWLDSGVSGNVKRMHNDGVGSSAVDDTGVSWSGLGAATVPVEIYAVADSKFRFVFEGTSVDISSNIPASTTPLAFWFYAESTSSGAKTLRGYYVIIRNDK